MMTNRTYQEKRQLALKYFYSLGHGWRETEILYYGLKIKEKSILNMFLMRPFDMIAEFVAL